MKDPDSEKDWVTGVQYSLRHLSSQELDWAYSICGLVMGEPILPVGDTSRPACSICQDMHDGTIPMGSLH